MTCARRRVRPRPPSPRRTAGRAGPGRSAAKPQTSGAFPPMTGIPVILTIPAGIMAGEWIRRKDQRPRNRTDHSFARDRPAVPPAVTRQTDRRQCAGRSRRGLITQSENGCPRPGSYRLFRRSRASRCKRRRPRPYQPFWCSLLDLDGILSPRQVGHLAKGHTRSLAVRRAPAWPHPGPTCALAPAVRLTSAARDARRRFLWVKLWVSFMAAARPLS